MLNTARVEALGHLPEGRLAHVERQVMQRARRIGYGRGIGFALLIGKDGDQSPVTGIEIEMSFI